MLEKLAELKQSFFAELDEVESKQQLSALRNRYLGRKGGQLTLLMKGLRSAAAADRKEIGRSLNQFKASVEEAIKAADEGMAGRAIEDKRSKDSVDLTLPGRRRALGHLHPLTRVRREIEEIFHSLGYSVEDGPEIETTYYNFEALNP
jgi:phenylalanyl-tRNA synthetase alpha chain